MRVRKDCKVYECESLKIVWVRTHTTCGKGCQKELHTFRFARVEGGSATVGSFIYD